MQEIKKFKFTNKVYFDHMGHNPPIYSLKLRLIDIIFHIFRNYCVSPSEKNTYISYPCHTGTIIDLVTTILRSHKKMMMYNTNYIDDDCHEKYIEGYKLMRVKDDLKQIIKYFE
jgi:hypothetical protein